MRTDVFMDDPVLGPIKQLICVVRQVGYFQFRGITGCETDCESAPVIHVRTGDSYDQFFTRHQWLLREDVTVTEVAQLSGRGETVGRDLNVASCG